MKNVYAMDEQQVENLAHERMTSTHIVEGVDTTYLRVLVTAAQARLGARKGKRIMMNAQLDALQTIATPYYAAVLRGVTTPDIDTDPQVRSRERNRRATFARTAKSTLVAWVREGGDLRTLDVATTTKGELRKAVAASRTDRVPAASQLEKAQDDIIRLATQQGPDEARETLEQAIAKLQAALDNLDDQDNGPQIRTRREAQFVDGRRMHAQAG